MRRRPRPGGAAQAGEARPSPQCSRGRPTWSGSKLTAELGDTLALPECRCKGSVGATTASRRCRAPERRRSLVRAKRKAQLHRAQTRSTSLPRKAWHRCYFSRSRRSSGPTARSWSPGTRSRRTRSRSDSRSSSTTPTDPERGPITRTLTSLGPEQSGPVLVPIASASGQPSWPCWTTGKSVPVNAFARRSWRDSAFRISLPQRPSCARPTTTHLTRMGLDEPRT